MNDNITYIHNKYEWTLVCWACQDCDICGSWAVVLDEEMMLKEGKAIGRGLIKAGEPIPLRYIKGFRCRNCHNFIPTEKEDEMDFKCKHKGCKIVMKKIWNVVCYNCKDTFCYPHAIIRDNKWLCHKCAKIGRIRSYIISTLKRFLLREYYKNKIEKAKGEKDGGINKDSARRKQTDVNLPGV